MKPFLLSLFASLFWVQAAASQNTPLPGVSDPVAPLAGPLMLTGRTELSTVSRRTFAWLANEQDGKLVIVISGDRTIDGHAWEKTMGQVTVLRLESESEANSASTLAVLDGATGIWFADDVTSFAIGTRFDERLRELAQMGVAVGGHGRGAESLGVLVFDAGESRSGFGLLPCGVVQTGGNPDQIEKNRNAADDETAGEESVNAPVAGLVHWEIPPAGAMVVHQGRRVAVVGEDDIVARVPAANGWPERVETFGARIVQLPFTTDLISWTRSAQSRERSVFPPETTSPVEVEKGTLILIGGGGSTDDMWTRFIESAGGPSGNFVCIPQSPDSFSAKKLRDRGCQNVTVLYAEEGLREKANSDTAFLEPLKKADGIFFGGGRTYRFMDAYQHTTAHRLMLDVLERGGVIAGTSAGAQIQGDFLVRGDPRTNQTLWYPGNDTGLSFLRGVIVDVHFAERGRNRTLPRLLSKHPQMLGIGIDEATAIVVTGHQAEVLGRGSAWFYDSSGTQTANKPTPVVIDAGGKYDLKSRTTVR
ncbi:Type 1 glutamine amidotransferase-like domain-containing protein [Rhodopirellula sallentina]|uniref:Cyanophycinase n=1 Tax=Rhodopirellula sallentina SM41 TaxID=1263870 RepID=M5U855_9BACT|nr:Type 1 glutamine amidotransferase-like domain-containing protein [Rhodopirellula sallentina]EMI54051.1 cyanophycinase [Rhodopirellula sallentina SM41]